MTKRELLMLVAVGAGVGIVMVPVFKLLGIGGIAVPAAVAGMVSAIIGVTILNRWRAKKKK